jgi:hypothetical protein
MLRLLVETACKALKREDALLRRIVGRNPIYAGQSAGILRKGFMDERYYQRIVARQLLTQPYEVLLEKNQHDLVLMRPNTSDRLAIVEMKLWMTAAGNTTEIVADMDKLKSAKPAAQHRVMLIFSANPCTVTDTSLGFLKKELSPELGAQLIDGKNFELDKFPTNSDYDPVKGKPMEFWVAGIEVGITS